MNNLILDKYLYELSSFLKGKGKEDIVSELRSYLEDEIDNYSEEGSIESSTIIILNKLGEPKEVAKKYGYTDNYVIGPILYDTYKLVLKAVVGAIIIGVSIGFIVEILFVKDNITNISKYAFEFIFGTLNSLFYSIGLVTLIFYLIEKKFNFSEDDIEKKQWTVDKLKNIGMKKDRYSISDGVSEIITSVVMIGLINNPEFMKIIPILNYATFENMLVYVNIVFLISLLFGINMLFVKFWNIKRRVLSLVINTFSLGVFLYVFTRDDIFTSAFISQRVYEVVMISIRISLIFTLVIIFWEIIKDIIYIIKSLRSNSI
jgi:hypothetical protein